MKIGKHLSDKTKKRMSKARMGHVVSEETKRKIRESNLGKKKPPHSIEWKQAMSLRFSGTGNPQYGKIVSEETRMRLRLSHLGIKPSKKSRTKMSMAAKGRPCLPATKEKIRLSRLGPKHWNWKGGKSKRQGYVLIMSPDHPGCTKRGYIFEHRIIAEACLGRFLKGTEEVHHVNKPRDDNRPENLMVFKSRPAHVSFEKWGKPAKPGDIIFDGRLLKH